MHRLVVPLLAAVMSAAPGQPAGAGEAAHGERSQAPAAGVGAPVLSLRRVPHFVSRVVADGRLREGIGAALSDPSLGGGRERSCLVVREGRRPIVARRSTEALIPASNMKILTGLAALVRLGAAARLETTVRAQAPVGADGVVAGPLWLVGGGDPVLATADYAASFENQPQLYTPLEHLADAVVRAGVRHVQGGVVGDESRFDTQRYIPTWRPAYLQLAEVGPASALDVNDGFSEFSPRRLAAREPDVHAAAVLTGLLQARGVVVGGPAGEGTAPPGAATVATVASPPVRELVAQMLRESDNLTAELLVKEMGRRFGSGGTTSAGLAVVADALARAGLDTAGVTMTDGSGLDRGNRASCAVLVAALDAAGGDRQLASGFPVAGRDGTLAKRFQANPAAGRLRAKTGALEQVVALTGYVEPVGQAPPMVFSLVVNDLARDAAGRALQEQVGALLARYPDAPPPAALAP